MFYRVSACPVDVVEVVPPGATEDHRSCSDMQVANLVCYNAPALNALPVHLLRQVIGRLADFELMCF